MVLCWTLLLDYLWSSLFISTVRKKSTKVKKEHTCTEHAHIYVTSCIQRTPSGAFWRAYFSKFSRGSAPNIPARVSTLDLTGGIAPRHLESPNRPLKSALWFYCLHIYIIWRYVNGNPEILLYSRSFFVRKISEAKHFFCSKIPGPQSKKQILGSPRSNLNLIHSTLCEYNFRPLFPNERYWQLITQIIAWSWYS